MPINRKSQSRRAYLEGQARSKYGMQDLSKRIGGRPTEKDALKDEAKKKKRGDKKKR